MVGMVRWAVNRHGPVMSEPPYFIARVRSSRTLFSTSVTMEVPVEIELSGIQGPWSNNNEWRPLIISLTLSCEWEACCWNPELWAQRNATLFCVTPHHYLTAFLHGAQQTKPGWDSGTNYWQPSDLTSIKLQSLKESREVKAYWERHQPTRGCKLNVWPESGNGPWGLVPIHSFWYYSFITVTCCTFKEY